LRPTTRRPSRARAAAAHDQQAGEDEAHVVHAGDVEAVAERAAEDGQEDHTGEHWRQQRLRPQAEHATHLAARERPQRAPLHRGQLARGVDRDRHQRIASM
jgi:hypothetical protein